MVLTVFVPRVVLTDRHDEAVIRHCCVAFGGITEVIEMLTLDRFDIYTVD